MKNTKKGFTLVELLVVIAILAILASVAVVGYTAFLDKANDSNAATEAHQIQMSADSFHMVGDNFVLGTYGVVTTPDDETTTDKNEEVVTTYTVYLAVDGKVYSSEDAETLLDTLPEDLVWDADLAGLAESLSVSNGVLTYKGITID